MIAWVHFAGTVKRHKRRHAGCGSDTGISMPALDDA
jgi:hypothetical protein